MRRTMFPLDQCDEPPRRTKALPPIPGYPARSLSAGLLPIQLELGVQPIAGWKTWL